MKRIWTYFLALLALMLAGTGIADAQTGYGLYVGQTQVTSANAGDVLGNGQFAYDVSTKTLTVTNATLDNLAVPIEGKGGTGISNEDVDGLLVKLVGNSTFTTRSQCVYSNKTLTFIGSGSLDATSTDSCGITLWGDLINLVVSGPQLSFTAQQDIAMYCIKSSTSLIVEGNTSSITLQPRTGRLAIFGLGSMTLGQGTYITEPAGGSFSPSLRSITTDGSTRYSGKVVISSKEPDIPVVGEGYGLWVAETEVTSANYDDVLGDRHFSYDAVTKTLYVKNATIDNPNRPLEGVTMGTGIYNRDVDGLSIQLMGENTFSSRSHSVYSEKSFTIGGGTLDATSIDSCGICLKGPDITCTVKGGQLNFTAENYFAMFSYNTNSTLAVRDSTTVFTLQPAEYMPTVIGLGNFTLGNLLYITEPMGCTFSPEMHSFSVDGTSFYRGKLVISGKMPLEPYGLFIGGLEVTSENAADVFGNGHFIYDAETKTLRVTNANMTIESGDVCGIKNVEVEGLTIEFSGTSTITTSGHSICSDKTFTLTGDGTLNATSTGGNGLYYINDCTIDGPNLTFTTNENYGIDANHSGLTMQGAATSLTLQPGETTTAIYQLGYLQLNDGQAIIEPEGGEYVTVKEGIIVDGGYYCGKVVINASSYGLYVAGKEVTRSNAADVLGNGQFRYDAETATLYVTDATLDCEGEDVCGIENTGVANLTIQLEGNNTFTTRSHCIHSEKSLSIKGSGTLNATSTEGNGIIVEGTSTCYIFGPKVTFNAEQNYPMYVCALEMEGSNTSLTLNPGEGKQAIYCFSPSGIDLGTGLYMVQPADGYFNYLLSTISTDGKTVYLGPVTINNEGYNLKVSSTRVTYYNASDIMGNGQFRYDDATKTLNVTNATLEDMSGDSNAIYNGGIEGLNICLEGTNTFAMGTSNIISEASFSITGDGTLNATSRFECINLLGYNITFTVDGPTLSFTSSDRSCLYNRSDGNKLEVLGRKTSLTLQPGSDKTIIDEGYAACYPLAFGDGITVVEPEGGYYSEELKKVTVDGVTAYKGKVVLKWQPPYGLFVADRAVTNINAADIMGNGQFRYDDATKTLYVTDAKLDYQSDDAPAIDNSGVDGLNICLEGTNTFTTTGPSIQSTLSLSFTGDGTLNATSLDGDGVVLINNTDSPVKATTTNCTVNGPQLTFTAANNALRGRKGMWGSIQLTVMSGTSSITLQPGADYSTVAGLKSLAFDDGVSIVSPEVCFFLPSLSSFSTNGIDPYSGTVVINSSKPYYGLFVADTRVTSDNAADILGNGQFSYDATAKTLSMKNANLDILEINEKSLAVCNVDVEGLTIHLEGDNRLVTSYVPVFSRKSLSFTGDGTLTTFADYGIMLDGEEVACTIDGPQLTINSFEPGIISHQHSLVLTVKGSTTSLSLIDQSEYDNPPIEGLYDYHLGSGVSIVEPEGDYFSEKYGIGVGSEPYYGNVVIRGEEAPVAEQPEEATLVFVSAGVPSKYMTFSHDISEAFVSPTFVSLPADRTIIWRTNIEEQANGGEPIHVEVQTEPFEVRLLNTDGTGSTYVDVVAYDEHVTALAQLHIQFYDPSSSVHISFKSLSPIVEEDSKELTVMFTKDKEEFSDDADLTNKESGGVLYTLSDVAGDGYDATEECIVLNSTMTTEEIAAVLEKLEPGSGAYAAMFSGMTFMLPAGSGWFDVHMLTMGDHALTVKIGDQAAATFTQNERGGVRIGYECEKDTYVYIYGSDMKSDKARMAPTNLFSKHAPHRAVANADAVKVYGITFNHVDVSTGIVSIGSKEGSSAVWNLAGQKVSTPRKGVYINQGRKIVVK